MLKRNNALESSQRYQLRYFRRNITWIIGLYVLNMIFMLTAYVQDGKIPFGFWIPFLFLPIFATTINPLAFNAQGVAWKSNICAEQRFLSKVGFVSWLDIESLTWQPDEKGGGSAVIRFPHDALRQHIPDDEASAPVTAQQQERETVEVTLALFRLDGEGEAIFHEMQQYWQQAQSHQMNTHIESMKTMPDAGGEHYHN